MEYNIKAIKTEINGISYRSRLEAKYGEFFRLLGWGAIYEPFDIPGWSPDFMIPSKLYPDHPILIEVKPFITERVIEEQRQRVKNAKNCFVILVGGEPFFDNYGHLSFGWVVNQPIPENTDWIFHFYDTADWKDHQNDSFDIGSVDGIFDGIVFNGIGNRKSFVTANDTSIEKLIEIWNRACSNVQWLKD
jgi:hypothetical protein